MFNIKNSLLFIISSTLLIAGCSNIKEEINKKWPPISSLQQKYKAILAEETNIEVLSKPNFGIIIPQDVIEYNIQKYITKSIANASDVRIRLDDQCITIESSFSFKNEKVELTGKLSGIVGFAFERDSLVLFPALQTIQLEKVKYWDLSSDKAVDIINELLRKYLDNINAELEKKGPDVIPLVYNAPIKGLWIKNPTLLIDAAGVNILAQLTPGPQVPQLAPYAVTNNQPSGLTEAKVQQEFTKYSNRFKSIRSQFIGTPGNAKAWVGFAKNLLVDIIDKMWPPVSTLGLRLNAINTAMARLNEMPDPNLTMTISKDFLLTNLTKGIENSFYNFNTSNIDQITNPKVELGYQEVLFSFNFSHTIKPNDVAIEGECSGTVTLDIFQDTIRFLPGIQSISIKKVSSPTEVDINSFLPLVNNSLNIFINNINGYLLNEAKEHGGISPIPIDTHFISSINLPESLRHTSGPTFTVTKVEGDAIPVNLSLEKAALLVRPSGLEILGTLRYYYTPFTGDNSWIFPPNPPTGEDGVRLAYDLLDKRFTQIYTRLVSAAPSPTPAIFAGVSRTFIADTINSSLAAPRIKAFINFSDDEHFSEQVSIAKGAADDIDCTPTRDCTPKSCVQKTDTRDCGQPECNHQKDNRDCSQPGCEHKHDTRNCQKCVLGACFNDPVCETAKAAQNQLYDREFDLCNGKMATAKAACELAKSSQNQAYDREFDLCNGSRSAAINSCNTMKDTQNAIYAGQKAACDAEQATWKLDCERLKTTEKTLCEGKKLLAGNLANLGYLGNVNGNGHIDGQAVVGLQHIELTNDMSSIKVILSLNASGIGSGKVTFDKQSALGFALCHPLRDLPVALHASIDENNITLSGGIETTNDIDGLHFRGSSTPTSVTAELKPSLYDALVHSNPDLYLTCEVLPVVEGIQILVKAFGGSDISEAFSNTHQFNIPSMDFDVLVTPMKFSINSKNYTTTLSAEEKSIIFSVN